MAVATSAAIIGGLGLAKGAFDTISANKRQKQHQAELDAYQKQELTNKYKDMQISTIGSDMMREESSRNIATAMNSIGNAGTRAIIGATPKLVAEQNNIDRNIQKELDDQVQKRNYAIAQDDAQIRGMQEQREYNDLAGIGNAIDTASQDKNMGFNTMLNGAMAIGSNIENSTGTPQVKPLSSSITPVGIAKLSSTPIQAIGLQLRHNPFGNTFKPENYNTFQTIGYPKPIDFTPKSNYSFM